MSFFRKDKIRVRDRIKTTSAGRTYSRMYDNWARRYDCEFVAYRYVGPMKVFESVADHTNAFRRGFKVLDVGVGTGWLSAQFRQANGKAHLTGVDVSQKMLDACDEKNIMDELKRVDLAAEGLKFDENSFDAVVSSGVFELLRKPAEVISEMAKVCKPGGVVSFTTLSPRHIWNSNEGTAHPEELIEGALHDSGLEIVSSEEFIGYNRGGKDTVYQMYTARKLAP